MEPLSSLPTLYKKASGGQIQQWHIEVVWGNPENCPVIVSTYGVLGGKLQQIREPIREGKNIGRANETSPREQAQAEATSRWEKKKKKHYIESLQQAEAGEVDRTMVQGGVAPMLAHKYHEQGHKISWPAFVQPKLDGHRCVAVVRDGQCTLWSRTQKPITGVPHVARAIEKVAVAAGLDDFILDGELYNHEYKDKFEKLSSFIRQQTPKPGAEVVQYWVYDLLSVDGDTSMTFAERNEQLTALRDHILVAGVEQALGILATFEAQDEVAMIEMFGVFMSQGYEGAMVRNAKSKYINRRSYDLQKVKTFDDSEFPVVDVVEGRGTMAGRAIFVCQTETGDLFQCKMMGALANLAEIFANKQDYIDRMLTVKYQGWTRSEKNGKEVSVPRFPVGVRLREDL